MTWPGIHLRSPAHKADTLPQSSVCVCVCVCVCLFELCHFHENSVRSFFVLNDIIVIL